MSEDCPICLNRIKDNFQISCCKKSYCRGCIDKWYTCNSTCPMCRNDNGNKVILMDILEYNALVFDIMTDMDVDIYNAMSLLGL